MDPKIIIEADSGGVRVVTIRVARGERPRGMGMLRAALPALVTLDTQLRESVESEPTPPSPAA